MRHRTASASAFLARASALAAGLVLCVGTVVAAAELKVGDPAPDFSLQASDGKTYKLSDFKGKKPVVIAWFPKAFTGGCTKQCTSYAQNQDAMKKIDVAYFTASTDDADTNTKFAKSLSASYPILADPTKATATAFGVVHEGRAVPERWTFYIDKDGIIRAIDKQINTSNAAPDTLAKLQSLGLVGK
jgi:peroxiredoxin Q/BCP